MAEDMDDIRPLKPPTAGVFDATEDGVMFGVGSGPILARAGVGGPSSGVGSRYRGKMVDGVGVFSSDVESIGARLNTLFIGVGVAGVEGLDEAKPHPGKTLIVEFSLSSMNGMLSN